jgi:hypothetical protein
MSLIRTGNGWVQLAPPVCQEAPRDKTLLEMTGIRQESNQAEWDTLHAIYMANDIVSDQPAVVFQRAQSDLRRKKLTDCGLVLKKHWTIMLKEEREARYVPSLRRRR